jgi:hypothetical protein
MEEYNTLSPELTSTLFSLTSAIDTTTRAITALAQHPYDYAKSLYFEPDHVFQTINDVQVPENVTLEILLKQFDKRQQEYENMVIDYLSEPSQYDLTSSNNQVNLLSVLSSDNKFVIPEKKYCSYIETLEILQSIDMDNITEENCEEIALKIGHTVLRTFTN